MKKRNKDCIVCSNQKVKGARKKHISVVRPANINRPCVLGNVSKDITPSTISKSFSVGPIVNWVLVVVYIEV
jgi:hypothetical protein